jgi:hypothetical protein
VRIGDLPSNGCLNSSAEGSYLQRLIERSSFVWWGSKIENRGPAERRQVAYCLLAETLKGVIFSSLGKRKKNRDTKMGANCGFVTCSVVYRDLRGVTAACAQFGRGSLVVRRIQRQLVTGPPGKNSEGEGDA